MIQTILSVVAGLVGLATAFVRWLHDKDLADSAQAQQHLKDLQEANARAQMAIAAREAQRTVNMQQPDSVLSEHDEFERPD